MIEKNPRTLIKKYSILSFALLFCIISAYQMIIFIYTGTQNNDAHKVNMAGRQRMLSQRIGKNLLLSITANSLENHAQFINATLDDINNLKNNHALLEKDLLSFLPFTQNSKLKADFIAIKPALLQMISAIEIVAKFNTNTTLNEAEHTQLSQAYTLYFDNEKVFLKLMDDIVKSYEIEAQNYISQLKVLSWIGTGFILIIMFINGRFVVYKSIQEIDEQLLAIKNHQEYQDTILSCSLDGIVSINTFGCITLMNKTAEKFFSCKEKDYLAKRITTLIPEFDFSHFGNGKNQYQTELKGRKKGGILFPVFINMSKIEASYRQGWVIFIKDLSLTEQIELELHHAKQKILDAVEANNAKSQFLANMSHELKTPLNAIIGFSQLLETDKESPLLPEQIEFIGYIHQAGTHLLSLINEILDLATLENSQLCLSLKTVNISEVIKEALILIYTSASKKHIQISNQFDSEADYFITADRIRIKQVLLNFLSNAIKYNHDHGTIEIKVDSMDSQYLKISVADNGRGISSDKLSQLFEPFNRLGAENSEIEGTGIGLTITKTLVEEMQGRIGVFSEENKGSIFWVELPLAEN